MLIEGWFDGVCEDRNPGGHGAWGAVVHIQGRSVYREGRYVGCGPHISNNVSEYSGVIAVFDFILSKIDSLPSHPARSPASEHNVIIRGDSKLVICQLNGEWQVRGGLYVPYYEQAIKQLSRLQAKAHTILEWIPREENAICDVLSKKVLLDRGVKFRIQPETVSQ